MIWDHWKPCQSNYLGEWRTTQERKCLVSILQNPELKEERESRNWCNRTGQPRSFQRTNKSARGESLLQKSAYSPEIKGLLVIVSVTHFLMYIFTFPSFSPILAGWKFLLDSFRGREETEFGRREEVPRFHHSLQQQTPAAEGKHWTQQIQLCFLLFDVTGHYVYWI